MATWDAVAATTSAILGLLEDAHPGKPFPKAFAPVHPVQFTGDKSPPDGFTLCLYRVAVSSSRRNLPPRLAPNGTRYRPSLPVDLYYLLTAWAADVLLQQRMLGWAMRELENNTILPAALLNKYLDRNDVFRSDETVELVCDPLALADFASLWDKLKPRMPTSVTYVARMVLIDSDIVIPDGAAVQTRIFEMAKVHI